MPMTASSLPLFKSLAGRIIGWKRLYIYIIYVYSFMLLWVQRACDPICLVCIAHCAIHIFLEGCDSCVREFCRRFAAISMVKSKNEIILLKSRSCFDGTSIEKMNTKMMWCKLQLKNNFFCPFFNYEQLC